MSKQRARTATPVKEANGTWSFVVDLGNDENGKRRQTRRRGFKSKKLAQEALDALRVSVTNATYVAPKQQTVGEFLDEWLDTIKVAPSTLASYRRNVRVHVKPAIGGVKLQKLDGGQLNRLYTSLEAKLSPRTIRYLATILHRAFRDAVRWNRLVRNPADAADPPRARDAKNAAPEMRTWDGPTLARFLGLVEKSRYRTPWLVLATTGMRRGEVLGLRWRDVDLDNARLSIRQTITLVDHEIVIAPRTKTGNGRSVDLDAPTVTELRAHRTRQAQELLLLGIRADADTLLFCLPDARPYNPDRFAREFTRALDRHPEIPRIRLHDLRHTWATLALEAGVPVKVVSERLGHSKTAVTLDTYSHVTPTMQGEAAARVAALIFG